MSASGPNPQHRRASMLIGAIAFTIGGIGSLAHADTPTGLMFLTLALVFSVLALRAR